MPYLQSFSINTSKTGPFPFNIPAVRFAKELVFDAPVTILVGDNGCGKSTILETIGLKLNLPLIGGMIGNNPGFEAARTLQPYAELSWKRSIEKGFFFRAEDFSDFINAVAQEKNKIMSSLADLHGTVDDSIIAQLTESQNYRVRMMRQQYGDDMQAYSHGEAYLKILQTRIATKGIFLLDEPEAALSPVKQLSLLSFLLTAFAKNSAQFIIATHSPIVMGLPGARIYQVLDDKIEEVKYRETDHYSITKNFLDNPQYFLRHL